MITHSFLNLSKQPDEQLEELNAIFIEAIKKDNTDEIETILNQYPEKLNEELFGSFNELNLIAFAARSGSLEIVKHLLDKYKNVINYNWENNILLQTSLCPDKQKKEALLDHLYQREDLRFIDGTTKSYIAAACDKPDYFINNLGALVETSFFGILPRCYAVINESKGVLNLETHKDPEQTLLINFEIYWQTFQNQVHHIPSLYLIKIADHFYHKKAYQQAQLFLQQAIASIEEVKDKNIQDNRSLATMKFRLSQCFQANKDLNIDTWIQYANESIKLLEDIQNKNSKDQENIAVRLNYLMELHYASYLTRIKTSKKPLKNAFLFSLAKSTRIAGLRLINLWYECSWQEVWNQIIIKDIYSITSQLYSKNDPKNSDDPKSTEEQLFKWASMILPGAKQTSSVISNMPQQQNQDSTLEDFHIIYDNAINGSQTQSFCCWHLFHIIIIAQHFKEQLPASNFARYLLEKESINDLEQKKSTLQSKLKTPPHNLGIKNSTNTDAMARQSQTTQKRQRSITTLKNKTSLPSIRELVPLPLVENQLLFPSWQLRMFNSSENSQQTVPNSYDSNKKPKFNP